MPCGFNLRDLRGERGIIALRDGLEWEWLPPPSPSSSVREYSWFSEGCWQRFVVSFFLRTCSSNFLSTNRWRNSLVKSYLRTSFNPMIIWLSFKAFTIRKAICMLSVDATSSFRRHVSLMQLVDIKQPVAVHVLVGVQVHLCSCVFKSKLFLYLTFFQSC